MKRTRFTLALATTLSVVTALLAVAFVVTSAFAAGPYPNKVVYSGQGLMADGTGGYDLQTEICGVQNGADAAGPYLLWVLTATGASNADITINDVTYPMTKSGNGAFKYVSGWYDPKTIMSGSVSATYDGKPKNVQLVISHGCRPYNNNGAWCSPGFWKNASDGAWALTGFNKTDLFNGNVYQFWYGASLPDGTTLIDVLSHASTYSGAPHAGGSGYSLNAFNATGAFLTDYIPGYKFDYGLFLQAQNTGETTYMCPIDNHGNFKLPQ